MPQYSRRKLLKGLAVTLPAVWSRPVVESVVLPAHAATTEVGCSALRNCYAFLIGGDPASIDWPGGTGPTTVALFMGRGCQGGGGQSRTVVVAANQQEAATLLSCGGAEELTELREASPGCSFFACLPQF
jgi:hypothetical protein